MSHQRVLQSNSLEATFRIGQKLGELCRAGDIICLDGTLGAGKTTLTQAIARGAGVAQEEYVCSPTFGLLHEYTGRLPIYHMDFYRLASAAEISEAGLEEYLYGQGVSIVEWYERGAEIIPEHHLQIHLSVTGETTRKFVFSSDSIQWQSRIIKLGALQ